MTWSRKHTLIAGLGLIAVTNAIALFGVVYNRGGGPEATLRLTQRELRTPYRWYANHENSGLALSLVWRVLNERPPEFQIYGYGGTGGTPAWLDKAKMEALGFDASAPAAYSDLQRRIRYEKHLPREVLLVLEMDGPAYRTSLALATQYLAREEAKLASNAGDKNLGMRVKNAREAFERETSGNSRLFVVDAGLEPSALRTKYPDTSRHAIVRGQVRVASFDTPSGGIGYISGLSIGSINVPFALRDVFGGATLVVDFDQRNRAPFEATVAFGKRFEPWVTVAAKK
jgi:uncharacterized protein DUF4824